MTNSITKSIASLLFSYLSDGKTHQMRIDFPFDIEDAEHLAKLPGSSLGFAVSIYIDFTSTPFYHYVFSGKLKNVLEGAEPDYWLPYCLDISAK